MKRVMTGLAAVLMCWSAAVAEAAAPNLVYILADDLGYGDVRCLNAEGKIATPNLDRLAAEGMAFTDAHSSSAVCTPTRYGILTGRYNWRVLKAGVLGGYSRPLITPERLTVAELLKQAGYATACVGKWHLGMDWPRKGGGVIDDQGHFGGKFKDAWNVDYSQPIQNGPNDVGFDEYFGISASLDMPPYLFIKNRLVTETPTVDKALWQGRIGPTTETFDVADVLPRLTQEAVAYLERQADAAKQGKPFFLYMPLSAPHTPIAPTKDWQGKSGINRYADFVMQTDHSVGEVLAALDRLGLAENTLVILTSDNGCSPMANYGELAKHGHNPSYHFRGTKADAFEGGHRVPFLVRWPATIKKGSVCDQTLCLTDFMATCADLLGQELPENAGEDSVSFLPALQGDAKAPLREATVHHSVNGSFAIRQGRWKLILCPDSGGWSAPHPGKESVGLPAVQLYDLQADVGETKNVQDQHPEVVRQMVALLEKYVAQGRSTPGAPQKNDLGVNIFRGKRPALLKD